MSEQKPTVPNLDELNQQFSKQYGIGDINKVFLESLNSKPGSKKRIKLNWKRIAVLLGCIILLLAVVGLIRKLSNRTSVELYTAVSSEEEFHEQFEKVNLGDKYVGLNETVQISKTAAHIGLVNSIGSDCSISIKIYDKEKGDIFYQSKKIMPGSILHTAVLDQPIKNTKTTVIDYTVYDLADKEQGVYQTDVKFVAGKTEKKEASNE